MASIINEVKVEDEVKVEEEMTDFDKRKWRILVENKDSHMFIRDDLMNYSDVLKATYGCEMPNKKNGSHSPVGYANDDNINLDAWIVVYDLIIEPSTLSYIEGVNLGDVFHILHKYNFSKSLDWSSYDSDNLEKYYNKVDMKFIADNDQHIRPFITHVMDMYMLSELGLFLNSMNDRLRIYAIEYVGTKMEKAADELEKAADELSRFKMKYPNLFKK